MCELQFPKIKQYSDWTNHSPEREQKISYMYMMGLQYSKIIQLYKHWTNHKTNPKQKWNIYTWLSKYGSYKPRRHLEDQYEPTTFIPVCIITAQ